MKRARTRSASLSAVAETNRSSSSPPPGQSESKEIKEYKRTIMDPRRWPEALLSSVWIYIGVSDICSLSSASLQWNRYFLCTSEARRHPLSEWGAYHVRHSLKAYYDLGDDFWKALRESNGIHSGSHCLFAMTMMDEESDKKSTRPKWHPNDLDFYVPVHHVSGPNFHSPLDAYLLTPNPNRRLHSIMFQSNDGTRRRPRDAVDSIHIKENETKRSVVELYKITSDSCSYRMLPGFFGHRMYGVVVPWEFISKKRMDWPKYSDLMPDGNHFGINIIYIDLVQFQRMCSTIPLVPRPYGVYIMPTLHSTALSLADYIVDNYDLTFLMNACDGVSMNVLCFHALRSRSSEVLEMSKWDWSSECIQHPESLPGTSAGAGTRSSLRQRLRKVTRGESSRSRTRRGQETACKNKLYCGIHTPWSVVTRDPAFRPRTTLARCITYIQRGFTIYAASGAKGTKSARSKVALEAGHLQKVVEKSCYGM